MKKQLSNGVSSLIVIALVSGCGGGGSSNDNNDVSNNTLDAVTANPTPSPSSPPSDTGQQASPSPSPTPEFFSDNATLQVVNTSYDSGTTNTTIDGTTPTALQNLAIQQVSTSVFRPTGNNSISLQTQLPDQSVINISDTINLQLEKDTHSTLVSFGPSNVIQHVVMQQDTSDKVPADEVQLDILHGSFIGADIANGDLDLYMTTPDVESLESVTSSLTYGTPVQDIKVSPGSSRVRITAKDDPNNVLFDSGNSGLSFEAGRRYSVVLADDISTANSAINVIVIDGDNSTTYLDKSASVYFKVVHLLSNAPSSNNGAIEFHNSSAELEPSELFSSLLYNNTEPANEGFFAGLPEGDYQFMVSPDTNSTDDAFFTAPQQRYLKGNLYTLILSGDATAAQPDIHLINTIDDIRPINGLARIKVINAALSIDNMDVYISPTGNLSVTSIENNTAGKALFEQLSFAKDALYQNLLPGSYDIRVVANGKVVSNQEGIQFDSRTNSSLIVYDNREAVTETLIINQSAITPAQ